MLDDKTINNNNKDLLSELGITNNNFNNVENISFLNSKERLNR